MSTQPDTQLGYLELISNRLSNLFRAGRMIYNAAPGWTLAWSIVLTLQGLLPVALVYLTRPLVNSLVIAIQNNGAWQSVQPVLFLAVLMAGVLVLMEILRGAAAWIRTAQSELIQDYVSSKVHSKAVSVDISFYESPEYYDHFYRATSEAASRTLALLESTGSLIQNSLTLVGMMLVLIPYGVWLPIVLLISTLPALYVVVLYNRRHHRWWEETTQDRRWTNYYDVMLTNSQSAAELRLFDLGDYFQTAYQALRQRLRGEQLDLIRKQSLARLGASTTALVILGLTMIWLVWQVILGVFTLGDLALIYQAFNQGQSLMRTLLSSVGQIYSSSLFLGNLFEFLDLQPQILDPPEPLQAPSPLKHGIRFQHITFYYPGSDRAALKDFNLNLHAGQIAAIVGENGAGKSTLVKLLCRFYDPQTGRIELDGINLRQISLDELRRMITILFQFPVPYHATVSQNIALGDLNSDPDLASIEAAARSAGAHEVIGRLPKGYDSLLGKWFADGMELSAGEWQRVALARAYFRRAPIIVLDEPTSFMDSWTEAEWFERFRGLAIGCTSILITHRFTIAMRADVIHVMQSGRIVESGSHADLLSKGGLYARSWTAQMQASSPPVSV